MLKQIVVASALAVFSIGATGCAQSVAKRQLAGVSTAPGVFSSVQACEAQKRRQATLVKQLAASYDAERVHNECVASAREAVASSKR
jgi:hypothetical protein